MQGNCPGENNRELLLPEHWHKKSGEELMDLMMFSHRYFNQTILMVTHDLDLARMAERVITLEDGRVISDMSMRG